MTTEEIAAIMPPTAPLRKTAEATGLSYYWLRKMCLEKKVASVRCSGKIYINLDSLAELLNGNDQG